MPGKKQKVVTPSNGARAAIATQNSSNNIANLPKYAVHGRGATKPPAPESSRTTSLKSMLVLCIPYSIQWQDREQALVSS